MRGTCRLRAPNRNGESWVGPRHDPLPVRSLAPSPSFYQPHTVLAPRPPSAPAQWTIWPWAWTWAWAWMAEIAGGGGRESGRRRVGCACFFSVAQSSFLVVTCPCSGPPSLTIPEPALQSALHEYPMVWMVCLETAWKRSQNFVGERAKRPRVASGLLGSPRSPPFALSLRRRV
jgi:hypothetical protein